MKSKKYEVVRRYYALGLWDKRMLGNAVKKSWISEREYEQITGEAYNNG